MFISTPSPVIYYGFTACIYGCVLTLFLLALIFGRRARRNVKKETVTRLPDGFSPLDVKRIFIGKTYPRRLTRALLSYWAERGYIIVKHVSKLRVEIQKVKDMPRHNDPEAVFFDRGTYVRERELFNLMFSKLSRREKTDRTINLLRPMFKKDEVKSVNNDFAVREDEGVYTARHYSLKLFSLVLSVVPVVFAVIWNGICTGMYFSLIGIGTGIIGLSVLMFANDMPIPFKAGWCGIWLSASVAFMLGPALTGVAEYDPLGNIYTAVATLFVGPLFLRRFIDYREKNNLAEYSDLINYRKYLLFTPSSELDKLDYYEILPFLYAFNIKPLVKNKLSRRDALPRWYKTDGERSVLL